jgi:hypothetical protein
MTKFESTIKLIHFPQAAVYNKLTDLNNLSALRERVSDPAFMEQVRASGQVPEDKLGQITELAAQMEFTQDTVTLPNSPIGAVTLRIVERDEPKCVKFAVEGAPLQAYLWIQLLPTNTYESKMRCTIGAELNFLMRQMAKKPLQEGVEKLADILAMMPYGY